MRHKEFTVRNFSLFTEKTRFYYWGLTIFQMKITLNWTCLSLKIDLIEDNIKL